MRFIEEYRDADLVKGLLKKTKEILDGQVISLMEVCGTHTMAIARSGLRSMFPRGLTLLSGPGCPVCVTATQDIDYSIALARQKDVIVTTFGDMVRVPGSELSLAEVKATGADVRIVYSTIDALQIARQNPQKQVIFLGVGFETTAPTVAAAIVQAREKKLSNFYVFSVHKLVIPAMVALLESREVHIDGFLCPGHVSVIIGSKPYQKIVSDYGVPCVISGFEPVDIVQSIYMLVKQIVEGQPQVQIQYRRAVSAEGNVRAQQILAQTFVEYDDLWRGLGRIPRSGLKLNHAYKSFDAEEIFPIEIRSAPDPKGCECGNVLKGVTKPVECPLFGRKCTPATPVGPCMVSSEGACAAYYKYGQLLSE
ncbi:MAG: hydrogenase formation protein HypD [candidate division KSB1 bacterium]|nr:hydrogenase formation protein HypD [candidate division KSB1 bacterium]